MRNSNEECETCDYKNLTDKALNDSAHCYMFREEPDQCMSHTKFKSTTKLNESIAFAVYWSSIANED